MNKQGFSLIELMVTISIIGIAFGIIITSSAALQKSGRDTQRQANLKTIQAALEQYHADAGVYPDTLLDPLKYTDAASGKTTTYLNSVPKDPIGTGTSIYTYVPGPSGSSGKWAQYCLYAKLESGTISKTTQCNDPTGTISVNQP